MSLEPLRDLLRAGVRGAPLDLLPYPAFLGVVLDGGGDDVRLRMSFAPRLVGAPERRRAHVTRHG